MTKLLVQTLTLLVLAGLAGFVEAETLSWTVPEKRVDGTPMAPSEIAGYRLVCSGVVTEIAAGQSQYQVTKHEALPEYGQHDCHMTAVDTEGRESQPSNTVSISWEKAAPETLTIELI